MFYGPDRLCRDFHLHRVSGCVAHRVRLRDSNPVFDSVHRLSGTKSDRLHGRTDDLSGSTDGMHTARSDYRVPEMDHELPG